MSRAISPLLFDFVRGTKLYSITKLIFFYFHIRVSIVGIEIRKKDWKRKCRWSIVVGAVCVRGPSFSHFRTLSLTRWIKMAGPSHSLVGSARGAELCDATVAVTWPCRVAPARSPVCDLTFVTAADCGEYVAMRNAAGSSGGREGSSQSSQPLLLPCARARAREPATTAQALSVAGSVGVRNWLGLYAKRQSVFFSLLSAPRQSTILL